jgi:prepilin-type N-terminal cleavage/methylation domain-containing protein
MTHKPAAPIPGIRGFTLIEMLMVVVVIGAMLAFGLPYFRSATTKSDVRGALDAVAALHSRTKSMAVQRGRVSRLVMDRTAGTMWVVANKVTGTGVDTVVGVQSMASRFGVTFTTVPTRDTLSFTPRGLGTESGTTAIIVTKGAFADTLAVSSAGRLIR